MSWPEPMASRGTALLEASPQRIQAVVQYDHKPIADIGEAVTLEDGEPGPKNGTHEARPAQSEPSSLHPAIQEMVTKRNR